MKKRNSIIIFHYIMVYIVMGSTYFFIKQAVESIPPLFVLTFRFLVGGTLLLIIARLKDRKLRKPTNREVLSAIVIGTFLFLTGVGFVTFGQQYTYSYITSLIVASVPLLVVLFDLILLKKKVEMTNLVGVLLGLGGVAILFYDGSTARFEISFGLILIFIGIISWSFATSISHKLRTHDNSLVNSGMQMVFAGGICLVVLLIIQVPIKTVVVNATASSLWALLYLGILGTFAFNSYVYLIQHEPAQKVSSYALVNPVVAIIFGILLGGEEPVQYLFTGLFFILFGLLIHFYGKILINKYCKK